jgi:hypothetical protein
MTDLERRCVLPFYLKMMRLNALDHDVPFGTLREVGRETADDDVARLLASGWRLRVMGAWLASGRTQCLGVALLKSLETSWGSLTAPPLATVALHGLGVAAVPSLRTYLQRDLEHRLGCASFVAAVLERLDAAPGGVAIDAQDRAAVSGMLIVARRLDEAEPESTADAVS